MMLRKKCKKTCLHVSLELVLTRGVTKTLPIASQRVARTLVPMLVSHARTGSATPHRTHRASQLLHTATNADDQHHNARLTTAQRRCACHHVFRKAAWTKALRAMHRYACGSRRLVRTRSRTRARRAVRHTPCMLYTLGSARTRRHASEPRSCSPRASRDSVAHTVRE